MLNGAYNEMGNLVCTLADDEPFNGALSGFQKPAGIILAVAGVLAVYIGIKVYLGYKLFPDKNQPVVEEKKYTEVTAKVLKKLITEMPKLNGGGMTEFVEWEVTYDVGSVVYTQVVPDDGYKEGDELKLMYSPDNPQEYYVGGSNDVSEETEQEEVKKNNFGIAVVLIGVVLAGLGAVLLV